MVPHFFDNVMETWWETGRLFGKVPSSTESIKAVVIGTKIPLSCTEIHQFTFFSVQVFPCVVMNSMCVIWKPPKNYWRHLLSYLAYVWGL